MRTRSKRTLATVVLIATLATIPLVILLEERPGVGWVQAADWCVWSIFVFEYLVLMIAARNPRHYVRQNPVNLLVILLSFPSLPSILGLVRLARLVRFLRLLRLAGITTKGITGIRHVLTRRGFADVAIAAAFLVLAGGTALALIEPETVRGHITDGIYWALFTVTTVGYSTVIPATAWGRMIGVVLMLTSVGLISTLAASITASFLGQDEEEELRELKQQISRMEALLVGMSIRVGAPTFSGLPQIEGPAVKSPETAPRPCPPTAAIVITPNASVIDHVSPLRRGGADTPSNMQWQPKAKDMVE
jgi:voltage-gated potassium channel